MLLEFQGQSQSWLEITKTLAPYATAITAIIVSPLVAWLAHRSWMKQFSHEKSYLLQQEKARLLQEMPPRLLKAVSIHMNNLMALASFEVQVKILKEGKGTDADVKRYRILLEKSKAAADEVATTSVDSFSLPITARVYFGEVAANAIVDFFESLNSESMSEANRESVRRALYETWNSAHDGHIPAD